MKKSLKEHEVIPIGFNVLLKDELAKLTDNILKEYELTYKQYIKFELNICKEVNSDIKIGIIPIASAFDGSYDESKVMITPMFFRL